MLRDKIDYLVDEKFIDLVNLFHSKLHSTMPDGLSITIKLNSDDRKNPNSKIFYLFGVYTKNQGFDKIENNYGSYDISISNPVDVPSSSLAFKWINYELKSKEEILYNIFSELFKVEKHTLSVGNEWKIDKDVLPLEKLQDKESFIFKIKEDFLNKNQMVVKSFTDDSLVIVYDEEEAAKIMLSILKEEMDKRTEFGLSSSTSSSPIILTVGFSFDDEGARDEFVSSLKGLRKR